MASGKFPNKTTSPDTCEGVGACRFTGVVAVNSTAGESAVCAFARRGLGGRFLQILLNVAGALADELEVVVGAVDDGAGHVVAKTAIDDEVDQHAVLLKN